MVMVGQFSAGIGSWVRFKVRESVSTLLMTPSAQISGLGSATVWATETLDASISGAGNIEYYGDPQVTKQVSGLGNVEGKGEK